LPTAYCPPTVFEHPLFRNDHYNAALADVIFLPVFLEVESNFRALRKMHGPVDDGAADARVATDGDVREKDGVIHFAVTVDADVMGKNRVRNPAPRDDATHRDRRVDGDPHAVALLREHELGRRVLLLVSTDGPLEVVQVEDRRNRNQVHVGFVIGLDGPDIPPVLRFLLVFVVEVVRINPFLVDKLWNHVLPEVVARVGITGVRDQGLDQKVAVEAINAHRDVGLLRVLRRGLGVSGFLLPSYDTVVLIDFHHPELGGHSAIEFDGANGDVRPGLDVLLEHQLVIHLVDVVAGKDQNILAGLAPERVEVLVGGVGGSLVPMFSHPPHGGQNL